MAHDIKVYTELRERLAELYPTEADQRRVARDSDAETKRIEFKGSAIVIWSNILADLRAHKRLPGLVAVLEREAPELAQLAWDYAAEVATSAGQRNRESRGEPCERTILAYESATRIDESCLITLLMQATPAKLRYAGEVEDRITKLDEIVRNPQAFLATIATIAKMTSPEQRGKAASQQLAYITGVHRELHSQMSRNEAALQTLMSHIDALCASPEQAGKALTTFAAFAALRIIYKLKKGFDWIGDAPRFWLEHYSFGSDSSPPHFDLVPDQSDIGRVVFGCGYWAWARVGHPPKYELVILPLKKVLPIFLSGTRGDQESFWTWILPQLAFYTRDYPITEFPVGDWEAYALHGRGSQEWWSRLQPPPWDVVTRINMADFYC